jgi:hypothetical protein
MDREEVLDRINKLDVLYKKLDVLDEKLKLHSIEEVEFVIEEVKIKKQIDKLFEL